MFGCYFHRERRSQCISCFGILESGHPFLTRNVKYWKLKSENLDNAMGFLIIPPEMGLVNCEFYSFCLIFRFNFEYCHSFIAGFKPGLYLLPQSNNEWEEWHNELHRYIFSQCLVAEKFRIKE